jgi:hypothetical protein
MRLSELAPLLAERMNSSDYILLMLRKLAKGLIDHERQIKADDRKELCSVIEKLESQLATVTAERDALAKDIEWIERMANDKRVWVIRGVARDAIARLKGDK